MATGIFVPTSSTSGIKAVGVNEYAPQSNQTNDPVYGPSTTARFAIWTFLTYESNGVGNLIDLKVRRVSSVVGTYYTNSFATQIAGAAILYAGQLTTWTPETTPGVNVISDPFSNAETTSIILFPGDLITASLNASPTARVVIRYNFIEYGA